MEFSPLLIIAIIWLLMAPLLSAAKKQQAKNAKSGAAKQKQAGAKAPGQQPETSSTYVAPEPARPTVMQPSITFTEHDDSVYQGSMNAVTGEGYDPCHDEQLAPLTRAEIAPAAAPEAAPGLQLSFTGNEIVRGFVMSEILTRK